MGIIYTKNYKLKEQFLFTGKRYDEACEFLDKLELGSVIQIKNLLFVKMMLYHTNSDLIREQYPSWVSLLPHVGNRLTQKHKTKFEEDFLTDVTIKLRQDIQSLITMCQ